jgi:hypothetical protein
MKIKEGFIMRKINDFYAVVPNNAKNIDFKGMMTLNETGKLLFEALSEDQSMASLVDLLVKTYQIDTDLAKKDVESFITKLDAYHLVIHD